MTGIPDYRLTGLDRLENIEQHAAALGDVVGGSSAAIATFSQAGTLTTGTGASRFLMPGAGTITGVVMSVNTAPTGQSVICDVKKNGSTIYSTTANRPTIAAGNLATTTEPAPDVTTFAAGDYLTVDISQIGSGAAGADLVVNVVYTLS